jgi:hypothetical protein
MPDLRERLADLLDDVEQPPLEEVAGRARTLRRRRRAARAGAALVAVVAVAVLLVRPLSGNPDAEVPPAGGATPTGPVYADLGITINGLVHEAPDLPGAIQDVEFVDPDHGYVMTTSLQFASTQDGGLTWQRHPLPIDATDPVIVLFGNGVLALLPEGEISDDGGQTWRRPQTRPAPQAAAGRDDLLRLGLQRAIEVWSPRDGYRGNLANQPAITVDWVAKRPTADGAWWVGGYTASGPALAVTRDGGRTWQVRQLDAPVGGSAQVSVLGHHAYAVVLGGDRKILAILHSADGGQTFTRTRTGGEPATLAGEAVPLLDGRLLVTTTTQHWYVSKDDGATFAEADGSLPMVGRIRRTWAGYVVYDLFGPAPAGWAAFSSDGSTWRKLHVR